MNTSQLEQFLKEFGEVLNRTLLQVTIGQIALSIIILILTFAFRKLFGHFIVKFLKKITLKTKTDWDDKLVDAIDPPARLLILSFGILFSAKVLGIETTNDSFMGHLVRSLIIFTLFWTTYRAADILSSLLEKVVKKTETTLDDLLVPFAQKGMKVLIIIIAITVIAKEWKYDIGTILAGLGLGGLAFALAAKDTLSNLFGGFTIMLDKPFTIGDWIYTSEVEGTVEEIGFRSTRVRTFAQALVTVPNSILLNTSITNWSKMGKRRIKFKLGVTYNTTAEQMQECLKKLREMLNSHPEVHSKTVFVYFENFGDSALEIFMYFFTKTTDWQKFLEAKEDINLKIMNILEQLGLEVAFPSTSVYLENAEGKNKVVSD